MECSSNQPAAESHESPLGISVKQEATDSCSYGAKLGNTQIKIEDGNKTSCEAMDTNNNNNALSNEDHSESKAIEKDTSPNKPTSATIRELRAKQVESTRIRASIGLSQADFTSPEFRSRTDTPVSSSQLLSNLPSSALFALEGLDFNTPVGSGQITPLASARIGRKRQLSVSPQLSSSSIDLNSLIRTSPTSLVNYITNSRSSSAGSIGHLSPSFFSKPARLQAPLGRPLQLSLRNAGYPLPPGLSQSVDQGEKCDTTTTTMQTDIKEEKADTDYQGDMSHLPDIKMEHDMPPLIMGTGSQQFTTLETVREESVGALYDSEDEGHPTSISDYPSADMESNGDSKSGIVDNKTKRVYYNYPSVEDPHHNQCKWADCTHQCDTLEALVQHVNNEHIYHDSRKEFVCYWNGCVREKKAFKAQYMLLVHMRRHTGEKPHKCTYDGCNKAYSRLENLKTHLRSHTGERPYVCKVEGCSKAFSNASDCAKHMNRTHTNEKPYACPNPGCTKRYTDPSSRRKHVKNCQVNKRVKTEDDSMSGAEEDAPTEPKAPAKKPSKPRKSEKRKANVPSSVPPPNPFAAHAPPSGGGMSLTDHGYFSGGSQGYNSSQLSFNNSMPEGDAEYPNLRAAPDEEISHILQQQRLSDPVDPVTMQSSIGLAMANRVGLSAGTNHVTDHMNPNVRASRQNGGGLTLPAGSIQPTPPHSHLHIHSSFPISQSQSKYSQYHGLPQSSQLTSNPRTNRMTSQAPSQQQFSNGRRNQTSNGQSMYRCYSPPKAGGMTVRKSPSDDSSVISGSLRSSIMTNSYSTFSSNSSRVSSPCSNSGRSDMMRPHPPISPRFNQTGFSFPSQTRGDYPLKQTMKVNSSFPPRETCTRRQSSDTWSERSWKSSQSSRYSFNGSELSDDLLDNLPSSARRSNFTKVQPLPFPESMQSEFTGMDCGTMTDQNGYMDIIPSQQMPKGDAPPFLSPDHLGQSKSDPLSTLPLHHFDSSNAMDVGDVNGFSTAYVGLFSQEAPTEEYDLIFNDLPYTASTSNMMVGDMSQFAGTLSEETQILEQMLRSRVK